MQQKEFQNDVLTYDLVRLSLDSATLLEGQAFLDARH
jgi:hypothetical protein